MLWNFYDSFQHATYWRKEIKETKKMSGNKPSSDYESTLQSMLSYILLFPNIPQVYARSTSAIVMFNSCIKTEMYANNKSFCFL